MQLAGKGTEVSQADHGRFTQMSKCFNATLKSVDLAKNRLYLIKRGTRGWSAALETGGQEEASRANPDSFPERASASHHTSEPSGPHCIAR